MTLHAPAGAAAQHAAPGIQPSAADRVPNDLFIAGQWQPAAGTMTVINPATEEVIAEVADADVADAERALRAAADAQPGWAATPARTRSEILYRTYQLMVEQTGLLAEVMTLEMGKPLAEARGEVAYAADPIRWFAEEAVRIDGGYAHRPDGAARNLQLKQPVGPCQPGDGAVQLPAIWDNEITCRDSASGYALPSGRIVIHLRKIEGPWNSVACSPLPPRLPRTS
jgi:hypothetical protein